MRVISLIGPQIAGQIDAAVPGVEVVALPGDRPVGADVAADVLVAMPRSPGLAGLPPTIPWVHIFGTGVDGVPDEVFAGRVVTCSADAPDGGLTGPDGAPAGLLDAARVGLGALGIVTAVTFRVVPAFLLEAREEPMTWTQVLSHLDELAADN